MVFESRRGMSEKSVFPLAIAPVANPFAKVRITREIIEISGKMSAAVAVCRFFTCFPGAETQTWILGAKGIARYLMNPVEKAVGAFESTG